MPTKKGLLLLGFCLAGSLSTTPTINLLKVDHPADCNQQDIRTTLNLLNSANPLCAKWNGDVCIQCATNSYANSKGICIQNDPLCQNFDQKNAVCMGCYSGYKLVNGKCVVSQDSSTNWTLQNPLCANWKGTQCIKCSNRSYFNKDGICIMANPDCKTYSEINGYCTSCYDGYKLENGQCGKVNFDQLTKSNPLCAQWSQQGTCLQCSTLSYKNSNGICMQVDPNCQTYSKQNGQCFSCYGGYSLKSGKCVIGNSNDGVNNPYCASWKNGVCQKCSPRTFMNQLGVCTAVSPLCRTFNQKSGDCESCYPGYKLTQGKCVQSVENSNTFDPGSNYLCGEWLNGKCIRCSPRSYMSANGQCLAVDANCNTYSQQTGECQSCYAGYQLQGGKCLVGISSPAPTNGYNDPLCSVWESAYKCKKCAPGAYFNSENKCTAYDANCKKFNDQQRICEECYGGFEPIQDKCIKFESPSFDITKCMAWKRGVCIQCAKGLELDSSGSCACPKVQ